MSRPTVAWVTDTMLTDRARGLTGFPTLAEAARELGHPVHQTVWRRDEATPDPGIPFDEGCVVAYGTHPFVAQAVGHYAGRWRPGSYDCVEAHALSACAEALGGRMLNEGAEVMPFADAMRRGFEMFGDAFFVKPDAVAKAFTGFVMRRDRAEEVVAGLRGRPPVHDGLSCVVARPRPIEGEFRFVIADGEVVAGSQYSWAGRSDRRIDVMPACREMADEVARLPWRPAPVYVLDVALVPGGEARVIEANGFSSAGLYACDTRAVVEAVSAAAARAYLAG